MRHLFIINPAAGKKGSTGRLEAMLDKLSFDHEVVYTRGKGDARRFAEEAVRAGEPVRIYACGGDGTLNEVVNGAAGCAHAAVTNVPKGTGNDFLKIFGPDYREEDPCQIVTDYIASMTDDYFLALHHFLFPKSSLGIRYHSYFADLQ